MKGLTSKKPKAEKDASNSCGRCSNRAAPFAWCQVEGIAAPFRICRGCIRQIGHLKGITITTDSRKGGQ